LLELCKSNESTTARKILENVDTLKRNYDICSLRQELPVTYYKNEGDQEELRKLLTELECKTLLPKIELLWREPVNHLETTEGILE
jgi:hypothetical protein